MPFPKAAATSPSFTLLSLLVTSRITYRCYPAPSSLFRVIVPHPRSAEHPQDVDMLDPYTLRGKSEKSDDCLADAPRSSHRGHRALGAGEGLSTTP
jgi:hypothetical protein